MVNDPGGPQRTTAWVLASSLIWAAVIVSTGDVGWPLVVWALTTFAPLANRHRPFLDEG
jgi:hypothetical protein